MSIKTIVLVILGFFFLALGALGLFLPVLPTTPFVLISAACFSGMPRLRKQIMRISFFKEYVENYQNGVGLSRKTVTVSLSYLWSMLLVSMLIVRKLPIVILLVVVGTAVTIHILYLAKANGKNKSIEK